MRYLFFDIECANCYKNVCKICEFGYVLTDDKFNVLEKELFLINPRASFQKYVIKNILNFSEEEYLAGGYFPKYYDRIKNLIEHNNKIVFGHSMNDDARYLNDEFKRYKLPFINFEFFDLKYIYSGYGNQENLINLEKMSIDLGRQPSENMHTSSQDALETMLNIKQICSNLGVSAEVLIKRFDNSYGSSINGVVKTVEGEKAKERQKKKAEERMARLQERRMTAKQNSNLKPL